MKNLLAASHILVSHAFEAEDLIKKLKNGDDFGELARDFSQCPSAKRGGSLGIFEKGKMVKTFENALLSLKVGEMSSVIRTQFGYHIIRRDEVESK